MIVFSKEWFKNNQKIILWFSNTPIIKIWFRWILRIRKYDLPIKKIITEITPNSFSYGDRIIGKDKLGNVLIERTTDFRTFNKFARRLYFSFYPLWLIFHFWDWLIADRFLPKLSFGFNTLTFNPVAGQNSPVDGRVYKSALTWSGARNASSGTAAQPTVASASIGASLIGGTYYALRSFLLFDTSSLTEIADITSAILSQYDENRNGAANSDTFEAIETNPANTNNLVVDDFDNVVFTSLGSIAESSITPPEYADITLNSTGLANINKTGISKFGIIGGRDLSDTAPTGTNDHNFTFADDETNDPKLAVTFTLSKTLSETMTMSETFFKTPIKILSDAFSLVETTIKRAGKVISDTFSLSEVLEKTKIIARTVIDTISMNETFTKRAGKVISDTISMSENIVKCIDKIISDTISMVQSITKRTGKILSDSFSLVETLKRYKNNLIIIWKAITRNLTPWTKNTRNSTSWTKQDKSE